MTLPEFRDGRIRLACVACDREDFDGVHELPKDWEELREIQSYEESLEGIEPGNKERSCLDWYTHLGICPDCWKEFYQ